MYNRLLLPYRFRRRVKSIKGDITHQDVLALISFFNTNYLEKYNPRMGFEIFVSVKIPNIIKLIESIDSAIMVIRNDEYQTTNVVPSITRYNVKLDDYLNDNNNASVDIKWSLVELKRQVELFERALSLKDTKQQRYYCRKYRDLQLEILNLLQAFVIVCKKIF